MKSAEREAARHLRKAQGMAIGRIADELGVAKSSVSRWVRDVELTAAQQTALQDADPLGSGRLLGQRRRAENARAARTEHQLSGRKLARGADPLHIQGCMLFWGEGSKCKNTVEFVNSDAGMMRLFTRFLIECYNVQPERILISCNCHLGNGLSLDEIEDYWLQQLKLPRSCLRTSIVNRPSRASSATKRTLPYGTARLRVNSTAIVQSIYGAIQEYADVERPAWLG